MSTNTVFRRLTNARVASSGCYVMAAFNPPPARLDSPALEVMTDLARIPAATIGPHYSLALANHSMILRGVRLLVVVDDTRKIVGVITTVDLLGEKPMMVAQRRQIKHDELQVRDVMTPVDAMEMLRIEDVRKARVGDIFTTLKADMRAHALVVGTDSNGVQQLQGIFSASQIARQLGIHLPTHEMARTFAEIEAAIAAG